MKTDAAFDRVLARYLARIDAEQNGPRPEGRTRDDLLLPVGEEAAWFLHALVVSRGAKCIVELGTSYGFSTLFFADAARRTGGHVHSFDVADYKQDYARMQLAEAGLDGFVTFHTGDAVELLKGFGEPIDFVLLDIWKDLYVPCLDTFFPKLADQAVIAADNILQPVQARPAGEIYRQAVRARPGIQTVLLPVGQGIELSVLWRDGVA
jgi:predicted O-methyltransferase YrrM